MYIVLFLSVGFLSKIFDWQLLGALGALTPGILGVGAAAVGGVAVVMDRCPASRPCRVLCHHTPFTFTHFYHLNL